MTEDELNNKYNANWDRKLTAKNGGVHDSTGALVAHVLNPHGSQYVYEKAKLFAAAPDLLSACEEALYVLDMNDEFRGLQETLRLAIDKAQM